MEMDKYYRYGEGDFIVGMKSSHAYNSAMYAMAMTRDTETLRRAVMPVEKKEIPSPFVFIRNLEFGSFGKFIAGTEKKVEFWGNPIGVVKNPMGEGKLLKVLLLDEKITFYFTIVGDPKKALNLMAK